MSTQQPASRAEFKAWCLRKLGFPVVQVNLDEDQIQDAIDMAIQTWRDYHFDGLQKVYYVKGVLQSDIDQMYIDLSPSVTTDPEGNPIEITGVTRIFPISDTASTVNMFDLRYQLRLNELYDFTSASYINYTLTMQHLRSLEIMFTGEVPIRYQRHMQRLYIDWGWGTAVVPGDVIIAECQAYINPDVYTAVYNDRILKELATVHMKKMWGTNLKKFGDMVLPGGVKLNGQKMYDEAVGEISRLEKDLIETYSLPPDFMMN